MSKFLLINNDVDSIINLSQVHLIEKNGEYYIFIEGNNFKYGISIPIKELRDHYYGLIIDFLGDQSKTNLSIHDWDAEFFKIDL